VFNQYQLQVNSAIEDRFRTGIYEEKHPDAAGVWPKVESRGDGPIVGWKRLDMSQGDMFVMELPYEEYPDLYKMRDELAWLARQMTKTH
jgi:hypothetical protein